MNNKVRYLILPLSVLLLIAAGAFLIRYFMFTDTNKGRSEDELLQTIVTTFPNFASEDEPLVRIESVSRFEDIWYVASVKSVKEVDNNVVVKILLVDNGDMGLSVLIGPDTHFSKYQTLLYDLPDSVIANLEES